MNFVYNKTGTRVIHKFDYTAFYLVLKSLKRGMLRVNYVNETNLHVFVLCNIMK